VSGFELASDDTLQSLTQHPPVTMLTGSAKNALATTKQFIEVAQAAHEAGEPVAVSVSTVRGSFRHWLHVVATPQSDGKTQWCIINTARDKPSGQFLGDELHALLDQMSGGSGLVTTHGTETGMQHNLPMGCGVIGQIVFEAVDQKFSDWKKDARTGSFDFPKAIDEAINEFSQLDEEQQVGLAIASRAKLLAAAAKPGSPAQVSSARYASDDFAPSTQVKVPPDLPAMQPPGAVPTVPETSQATSQALPSVNAPILSARPGNLRSVNESDTRPISLTEQAIAARKLLSLSIYNGKKDNIFGEVVAVKKLGSAMESMSVLCNESVRAHAPDKGQDASALKGNLKTLRSALTAEQLACADSVIELQIATTSLAKKTSRFEPRNAPEPLKTAATALNDVGALAIASQFGLRLNGPLEEVMQFAMTIKAAESAAVSPSERLKAAQDAVAIAKAALPPDEVENPATKAAAQELEDAERWVDKVRLARPGITKSLKEVVTMQKGRLRTVNKAIAEFEKVALLDDSWGARFNSAWARDPAKRFDLPKAKQEAREMIAKLKAYRALAVNGAMSNDVMSVVNAGLKNQQFAIEVFTLA
jgi:hypothetical protein